MDLASAKDGNADNTTSKAQSEKNMTGSTASKNTTSKATTESKKETTTTTSPATTVSSGNLICRYRLVIVFHQGMATEFIQLQESENCMLELIFHVQLEQRS